MGGVGHALQLLRAVLLLAARAVRLSAPARAAHLPPWRLVRRSSSDEGPASEAFCGSRDHIMPPYPGLRRLDKIDVDGAARFVASCRNFDGGFGATPGGESHAGQVFTAVGEKTGGLGCVSGAAATLRVPSPPSAAAAAACHAQALSQSLGLCTRSMPTFSGGGSPRDRRAPPSALRSRRYAAGFSAEGCCGASPESAFAAAAQVKGGGLNGRPEKLPDVCYSWRASFPPA